MVHFFRTTSASEEVCSSSRTSPGMRTGRYSRICSRNTSQCPRKRWVKWDFCHFFSFCYLFAINRSFCAARFRIIDLLIVVSSNTKGIHLGLEMEAPRPQCQRARNWQRRWEKLNCWTSVRNKRRGRGNMLCTFWEEILNEQYILRCNKFIVQFLLQLWVSSKPPFTPAGCEGTDEAAQRLLRCLCDPGGGRTIAKDKEIQQD